MDILAQPIHYHQDRVKTFEKREVDNEAKRNIIPYLIWYWIGERQHIREGKNLQRTGSDIRASLSKLNGSNASEDQQNPSFFVRTMRELAMVS
ncbi:hypothetical protein E3N88_26019 [Mikania micrantha]|uniref:Uncharacterized protein n=1 Tax=Mikania micrantha TaxID=192012 RepID=A0A5N6N803_9ASTR|nr:hypothetical protein E3N88_26019 [Mikania micrantha]